MNPIWLLIGLATAAAIVVTAIVCAATSIPKEQRRGALAVIVIGFAFGVLWAAVKPSTNWPTGIRDDGSLFDTNDWRWVEFRWKLQRDFPAYVPLTFDAKPRSGGNWFNLDVAESGLLTNRIDLTGLSDHPTNYIFRVTSEYTPGTVEIKDFSAKAATNAMEVVCCWTSPTNLVGLVGNIQYRLREPPGSTWTSAKNVVIARTNEVHVAGNFVNRRIDRDFRIVVDGYSPFVLINLTDAQLKRKHDIEMLNFHWFYLPGIKRRLRQFQPESLKGVRL